MLSIMNPGLVLPVLTLLASIALLPLNEATPSLTTPLTTTQVGSDVVSATTKPQPTTLPTPSYVMTNKSKPAVDTKQLPDNDYGDVDHFTKDHPVDLTGHVTPYFTKMNISWAIDVDNSSSSELLDFTIFYAPKTKGHIQDAFKKSITVPPTARNALLEPLDTGTLYSFYVMANYSTGHMPYSHTFTFKTLGYGRDNPCNCDPLGIVVGSQCNPRSGQCECKNGTTGRRCEQCRPKYYKYVKTGCDPCGCTSYNSDGTCYIGPHGIIYCNCQHHFAGARCTNCEAGYYMPDGKHCKPCNCNGNDPDMMCENTGKCTSCQYNTTGDHCELCLPGYIGDAVHAHNCTKQDERDEGEGSISGSSGVALGVCLTLLLIVVVVLFALLRRRCCKRKPELQFWTVELKDDHEQVNFSSLMEQPEFQRGSVPSLFEDNTYYDRAVIPSANGSERPRIVKNKPRTELYQTLQNTNADA